MDTPAFASSLHHRAAVHRALGDPLRLAIVDALALSDRTPSELEAAFEVPSNLVAHHLDILGAAGVIHRTRSSGDRRRRYVSLVRAAITVEGSSSAHPTLEAARVLFVCTANSSRSPLAAALWEAAGTGIPATSAGTIPAKAVHPLTVEAATSIGLTLTHTPQPLEATRRDGDLVVTVCDQAREGDAAVHGNIHWSIPDPAEDGRPEAFVHTTEVLRERITELARCTRPARKEHNR